MVEEFDFRAGGLDQRELEAGALVGAGAHALERLGQQLEQSHDGAVRNTGGLLEQAAVGLGREGQLGRQLPERLDDQQLACAGLQARRERGGVTAGFGALGQSEQRRACVAGGDGVERPLEQLRVRYPEHRQHVFERDRAAAVGEQLLERAERIPKAAGRRARQRRDGLWGNLDVLRLCRASQHLCDLLHGGALEVESLATVDDRRGHLLRLGGGEHEHGVRRGLLERLQERVPGRGREHVGLVQDVDLAPARYRRERNAVAQLADVVDRVVRGGVHLDHVQRARARDRDARVAGPAGLHGRPVLAVQAGGQDLRHRCLAGPARAYEEVGVMDLIALHGVAQRAHYRLLPDDFLERARPVPAIQGRGLLVYLGLVRHAR